jgi:hypothetical protein
MTDPNQTVQNFLSAWTNCDDFLDYISLPRQVMMEDAPDTLVHLDAAIEGYTLVARSRILQPMLDAGMDHKEFEEKFQFPPEVRHRLNVVHARHKIPRVLFFLFVHAHLYEALDDEDYRSPWNDYMEMLTELEAQ